MMRTTVWKDAKAAMDYLTTALKKEDYFFVEKEISAIYAGRLAQLLGLSGRVSRNDFKALVNGVNPVGGKSFILRKADNRRVGYEYCFNAPKSVSLLYAFTKDKEILNAHRLAVRSAMAEIERDMQTKNKVSGRIEYEDSPSILYARFDHFTTRPLEETDGDSKRYVPDPHLHSHCFMFNVTWSERNNRLQSLEEGNIRILAPYYESVYHSVFSKALADKGYPITRTQERWEVGGISRPLIEKFSRRTMDIEALAREKGLSGKAKAALGARTRIKKNKSVEEQQLYRLWEERLSRKELFHIRSVKGSVGAPPEFTIQPDQAIERSLDHYLERKSAIPEKRVLAQALSLGYGRLLPDEVQKSLKGRKDILSAIRQTIKYITTKDMVRAEDKLISLAVSGKGMLPPLHPDYNIRQDILSAEQRNAVHTLLQSQDAVTILHGGAGVGKSSLLTELQLAVKETGNEVFAFEPSAGASRGVLRAKDFKDADTITSLLRNKELQGNLYGHVMIVDEAGQVGTHTMLELVQLAKKQKARLILSGDTLQHNSVEAGDALRLLRQQAGLRTVTVKTVIRQQKNEVFRKAIQDMAEGKFVQGYKKLDKAGAIIEHSDQKERESLLAEAYVRSLERGRSAIVVSPTHTEGQTITRAIRSELKRREIIQGKERVFTSLRNNSFTEEQKKDEAIYEDGMYLRFHQQGKGGFKAGQGYRVIRDERSGKLTVRSLTDNKQFPFPAAQVERFEVYTEQQIPLAKGDKVRITLNGKTREETRIHNGQAYEVKGFTQDGHIRLSNGKTLDKDFRHFTHGHVATSYASQGKDAQDVFLAQSSRSLPASNEKQFYVSASRGRERCFIYTDDKENLAKATRRSADRVSAIDIAKQYYQRITHGRRVRYYEQELNRHYATRLPQQPQPGLSRSESGIER